MTLLTFALIGVAGGINAQPAAAAVWPNDAAMACDGTTLRRSFIFDPGRCNAIPSARWADNDFVSYFGTDRGRGRFDRNFMVWAPISREFHAGGDWTFCGSRNTSTHNFCPSGDIRTNPISAAIGDRQITAKRWNGNFIGVYCGNYNPHGGTAAGPAPSVRGTKYLDVNGNGQRDLNEPGLQGWTIDLSYNGSLVASTTTAADGSFEFTLNANGTSLRDGTYHLTERPQPGYRPTASPAPFHVPLHVGAAVFGGKDFGNYRIKQLQARAIALAVPQPAGLPSLLPLPWASVSGSEAETPQRDEESAFAHSDPAIGSLEALRTEAEMSGGAPHEVSARASASIVEATITLPGGQVLEIGTMRTASSSMCSGSVGQTRVSHLWLDGEQLSPDELEPEPDTRIELPGGSLLILNEQVPLEGSDQGLTVIGAHVLVPGGLEIVVALAESGITNC